MSAELTRFSLQKRTPTPKSLLDLFLNEECIIDNEAEFVENFRKKFGDLMLIRTNHIREYNSWKYVVFRIYEVLDKRIQELKTAKTERPTDAQQVIKTCEESIENCITMVRLILRKIKSINTYFFPYFGKIIEVTRNPNIIRGLVLLSEFMMVRSNKSQVILSEISPLVSFLTPSLRLIHHCQWDFEVVRKIISEASLRENKQMSESDSNNVLNRSLNYAKTIFATIEEEQKSIGSGDKLFFLDNVFAKVCEQEKISQEKDEAAYHKALGEIYLASSLLNINPNGVFLSDLCLTYIFNGSCLTGIKGKNYEFFLHSLITEPCHQQFQCPLNLSLLDIMAQHSRNLSNKQLSTEALGQEIEALTLFFIGLESQVLLLRTMEMVPENGNSFEKLLRRLFYSNSDSSDIEAEPLLVELWRNCNNLYREYYSNFKDESENLFAVSTDLLKDKVNLMMWHYMLLLVVCMQQIIEESTETNLQKFKDEYSPVANFLVDEILKAFERFDLENNYISFLTLHSMFTIFRCIQSYVSSDLRLHVRIIEKMESILQWSYSPDFLACFEKAADPQFLKSVLIKITDLIQVVIYFETNTILYPSQEHLMAHMSTFNYIDFITNTPKVQGNPHAMQSQERIIRSYLTSHFISQHLTAKSEDTDLFVYYTLERLEQMWKIIQDNSTYQMPTAQEFAETIFILEALVERDQNHARFYRVLNKEIMLILYCDCVLKNDAELVTFDEDTAAAILGSLQTHNIEEYKQMLSEISQGLEKAFKEFEADAELLDRLYQENDPKFTKTLFVIEIKGQEFMKRLEPFYYRNLNTTADNQIISPEFESMLQESLARLLVSPLCYMLNNPIYVIRDYLGRRFDSQVHFLTSLLPKYIDKFSESLTTLNKDLQDGNSESQLIKSFEKVHLRFLPGDLFMPSLNQNPKDSYKAASKLFIFMIKECINIDYEPVDEYIPLIVRNLEPKLEEIAKLLVTVKYFTLKNRIKDGSFSFSDDTVEYIDQFSHFDSETVQSYYVRKTQVLFNLVTTNDSSKSETDHMIFQLCALSIYHQFISELEDVDHEIQIFQKIEGSTSKIYGFCLGALVKFSDLVSKRSIETKTIGESDTEKDANDKKKDGLMQIYRLLRTVIDQRFYDRLVRNPNREFCKELLKVLMEHIDNLGLKLWPLYMLKMDNLFGGSISLIWTKIFELYESVLRNMLKLPELNSLFQTSGKEEPLKEELPDPALLEYCKEVMMKLLSKYIIYYEDPDRIISLSPVYFDVYKEFMNKYVELAGRYANGIELGSGYLDSLKQSETEIAKIFKNEVMNGIRALSSVFVFFAKCEFWNKHRGSVIEPDMMAIINTDWIMESFKIFVKGISALINNLKVEDILKEDQKMVKNDFLMVYSNICAAMISLAKDLLIYYSDTKTEPIEFNHVFNALYGMIKKYGAICRAVDETPSSRSNLNRKQELIAVFNAGIVYTNSLEKLANDEEMLELLQDLSRDSFYNIVELYVAQSYEPDKILSLKLKTLGQLDNSGKRFFQNVGLKAIENYWQKELQEIWNNEFEIQECEKPKHKFSTKQVVIKGEKINLDGKMQLQINQETKSVPTLAFLKEGINQTSKGFIEYIMRDLVSRMTKHFSQIITPPEILEVDSIEIQNHILWLASTLKVFPEVSVTIASYPTAQITELSPEYKDLLPVSKGPENFIGFFVRYVCFIRHFAAFYMLENMITKNDTPIFIEYEGKPILLNAYNELIIFQEIFKALKEVLDSPEDFLKTQSSFLTWSILCALSIRLLRCKAEPNQPNYKLQIIATLSALCQQALEVFYKNNGEQEAIMKEETRFIYVLLAQLAELESFLKDKKSVDIKSNNKSKKLTRSELRWAQAIFKEDSFAKASSVDEIIQQEGEIELLSLDIKFGLEKESNVLKGYKPHFKGISSESMQEFIREKRLNPVTYRSKNLLYHYRELEAHDLIGRINKFVEDKKSHRQEETSEKDNLIDRITTFILCPPYFERSRFLSHFNLDTLSWRFQMNIFKPEKLPDDVQKTPKFRVTIKKALAWKYRESKIKSKAQVAQLLEKDQQEDFASLIKKMGFENVSKLIQQNKGRVKLLIQQQHEKFLMAKLESLVNQQVNIEQFLGLETSVDNLAFFNEQTSLDQKLILLLANKDFVKSLGNEAESRSVGIRKAYFEHNRKKKTRGQDNDEEGEEEEEEKEDYESEGEGEGEDKIEEEKAKEVKPEGAEGVIEKADMQVEQENGLEKEGGFVEGNAGENGEGDWEDEMGDNEGDWASGEDKGEEGGLEEIQIEMEGEEEEQDGEGEDAIEMEGENGKEIETTVMDVEAINGEGNLPGIGHKTPVSTARKSRKPKEDDAISSDCHTDEAYDVENGESERGSNNEDEDYNHEDDDNIQEFCTMDDYNLLSKDCDETKKGLVLYNHFRNKIKAIRDKLNKIIRVDQTIAEKTESKADVPVLLEDLLRRYFLLFNYNNDVDKFKSHVDDPLHFQQQNTYSLVSQYAILTLLDPAREAYAIPLFALYVAGHNVPSVQQWSASSLKYQILRFLNEYALRSPSVFFRTFNINLFKDFLQVNGKIKEETFTIFDLLFEYYLSIFEDDDIDKKIQEQLQFLLDILFQIWFVVKEEDVPEFIKNLRQNKEKLVKDNTVRKLLSFSSSLTKDETNETNDQTKYIYQWLQHLAKENTYTADLLSVCCQLIKTYAREEKDILEGFNIQAAENLQSTAQLTFSEKAYFQNFLSRLDLQVPSVLTILSYLINEKIDEFNTFDFIQAISRVKSELKDVSTSYMETLETVSNLQEKKYIESITSIRGKLKEILEVPVQIHLYFSKLKEDNLATLKLGEIGLVRSNSSTFLRRSHSMTRRDTMNFQEGMVSWLKKRSEFVNNILEVSNIGEKDSNLWVVKKFPWILDFKVKEKILREAVYKASREQANDDNNEEEDEDDEFDRQITLFIRRDNILEDTMNQFETHQKNGVIPNFKIEFVREPGVDQGGLKKEWMTLLSKEIFDPRRGLFKLSPNMRTIHPNPLSVVQSGQSDYFKLAGTIAALAIKEQIPIDVNFSKSLLKLLLGGQPNLNDLEDVDPELMNSLTWMINNEVTGLDQPFIYELDIFGQKIVQELIEDGNNTEIDDTNKELYISALCEARTQKEVDSQIQSFKAGFSQIIPHGLLELFSAGEIEILISGKSEIDIQDLKRYALYKEVSRDNVLVQWFWEIVEIMDQDMLANLLFFITGTSKVPHGGFKDHPITLRKGPDSLMQLPIAHTCFREMEIPLYDSKEQFYEKLVLAISEGKEGFYIS